MPHQASLDAMVQERIRSCISVHQTLLADRDLVRSIALVSGVIVRSLRSGHKLLLFGNGGSAADAQHIAAELVGRYLRNRAALPAVALTTNTSSLTAIANDRSFDHVFARQIEALGRAGDVALGISTSGRSRNVLLGIKAAERRGLVTVGMSGKVGGQLKGLVDYLIRVPSKNTPRIQEAHILIGHVLCEILERELAPA
ncbi:MAG TPA: D-sedoheptulose 7-phosphate isomerase [Terriglobia bacterium]|nr:D-sedoheptulose 7-phosphate isomerase [Terriglobia bacterium]